MASESIVSSQKSDKRMDEIPSTNPMNLKDRKGFTLLEILMAIFIFSIVLSILYATYTGTFRNIDETESQAEIYRMARIALERMVEDLESAYLSHRQSDLESEEESLRSTEFVGEATEIDDRSADTLRFLSRAHLVFDQEDKEAGIAQIAYEVRQSAEEEASFVLYRSDTPGFEEGPEEGTGGLVLCEDLYAINFTYYDDKGREHDRWDSTNEEFEGKLPVMVSIVLEFVNRANPKAPLKFMTGVALPMAQEEYEKAS